MRRPSPDTIALITASAVLVLLSVVRAYHLWSTGVLISDEYGYILSAYVGEISNHLLANRYFFGFVNAVLFGLFGVSNIDSFLYFFPLYLSLWGIVTVLFTHRTLRELNHDPLARALAILSLLFLPSFAIMSVGFLTETPALAMASIGLYFLVLAIRDPKPKYSIPAALAFAAAAYTREPYLLLAYAGWIPLIVVYRGRQKAGVRANESALAVLTFVASSILLVPNPLLLLSAGSATNAVRLGSSLTRPIIWANTLVPHGNLTLPPTQTSGVNLINAPLIYGLGLLLGMGPLTLVAGGGLWRLFLSARKKEGGHSLPLLLTAILFLLTFAALTVLFSSDSSYTRFQHYSTLLRYSNTTVPAFIIAAPYFFSALGKRKKSCFVLLVLSYSVLVPFYTASAQSNLGAQTTIFDFQPHYPDVAIRNYLYAHQSEAPFFMMGASFDPWTPGLRGATNNATFLPYLEEANFTSQQWKRFYIYGNHASLSFIEEKYSYLLPLLQNITGVQVGTNEAVKAYHTDSVIFNNELGFFIEVVGNG